MGLKQALIAKHIDRWSKELGAAEGDPRANWPKYLFHHASLKNAGGILTSGSICSRSKLKPGTWEDCASPEVLGRADYAHSYARLYFRPRNPTQFHVEGIKNTKDPYLGGNPNVHIPMLCFLAFEAQSVLQLNDVVFSDGNAQHSDTAFGQGKDFFEEIQFEKVFHDRRLDPKSSEGREIIRSRCAEVLVPGSLSLDPHLARVYCRSHAERTTLLDYLGKSGAAIWRPRIGVVSTQAVFFQHYSYIDNLEITDKGCTFTIHPRRDGSYVHCKTVCRGRAAHILAEAEEIVRPGAYDLEFDFKGNDVVRIEIYLDDHLAAAGNFTVAHELV